MKLTAILFFAAITGATFAREISSKENVLSEIANAKIGDNKVCFHCEEEPETEWYSSGVFYQIYPKSCELYFSKFIIYFKAIIF